MAAPLRLKIISALCQGDKNVGELLQSIDTWVSLRREQGLNAADAMAVIRQATRALIAGLD